MLLYLAKVRDQLWCYAVFSQKDSVMQSDWNIFEMYTFREAITYELLISS